MKLLRTLALGSALLLLAGFERAHAQVPSTGGSLPTPATNGASTPTNAVGIRTNEPDVIRVPAAALPPALAARERQLTTDLTLLRDSNPYRVWLGVAALTFGAATVGLGAAYPHDLGPFLIPLGATAFVHGVVGFAVLPDPRIPTERYLGLPSYTPAQAQARIRYGEATLAYLAARARAARLIDGSLGLLLAASYTPLTWWISRRENADYRFGDRNEDYAVLALSVVAIANALVNLFGESLPEERHQAYRELLSQQTSLTLILTPTQLTLQATLPL